MALADPIWSPILHFPSWLWKPKGLVNVRVRHWLCNMARGKMIAMVNKWRHEDVSGHVKPRWGRPCGHISVDGSCCVQGNWLAHVCGGWLLPSLSNQQCEMTTMGQQWGAWMEKIRQSLMGGNLHPEEAWGIQPSVSAFGDRRWLRGCLVGRVLPAFQVKTESWYFSSCMCASGSLQHPAHRTRIGLPWMWMQNLREVVRTPCYKRASRSLHVLIPNACYCLSSNTKKQILPMAFKSRPVTEVKFYSYFYYISLCIQIENV